MTLKKLSAFATVLLALASCTTTTLSSATEVALCNAWEDSLFLPSRSDTIETARGLNQQRVIHEAACM